MSERVKLMVLVALVVVLIIVAAITFLKPPRKTVRASKPSAMLTDCIAIPEQAAFI